LIDPIADDYRGVLDQFSYKKPLYSLISCVTGKPVESLNAEYFWRISREPIRFREAVQYLIHTGDEYYCLDLSPSGTLATFMKYMTRSALVRSTPIMTPFGHDLKTLNSVLKQLGATEFAS
jgi:bacillaene synthase trans-acting acyltransferase